MSAATAGLTKNYLATDNRNIDCGDFPVPKPDMDHLEYIRILLERGANVNARVKANTETRTILTMQWFFEAGATPFVRASQSGDTTLMKLLLAHGADPKIAANSGDTALAAAAGMGWFFFSSRRRHTRCSRDWSSDVCSSDLRFESFVVNGSDEDDRQDEAGIAKPTPQLYSRHIAKMNIENQAADLSNKIGFKKRLCRSEERRVGKECRSSE